MGCIYLVSPQTVQIWDTGGAGDNDKGGPVKRYVIALLILGVGGCAAPPGDEGDIGASSEELFGRGGDFDAAYVDCDEYAGVGPVFAIDRLRELVPEDYFVIEPFPGAGILVAQAGSCADIEIEGYSFGPGTFAQIGVSVAPPGDPGAGDFYQLAYATDNLLLALKLRRLGANARFVPRMSYEISDDDILTIDVPRPFDYAFVIQGPITRPDETAPPNPTTVFNYYVEGRRRRFGNINQQNVVEGIRFGEGSAVTLTPIGSEITTLTGGGPLAFPFFSAPEVFDRADLMVETNAF